MHEGRKNGARESASRISPLGMPLHSKYKVAGRVQLHRLHDAVQWGDSGNAKMVAHLADGLVVAGVNLRLEVFFGGLEGSQARTGGDADRVRLSDQTARRVIDAGTELAGQVLKKGAIAPDIQCLGAVADAQNGLVEAEGVLKEKLIGGGAGWVIGAAGWDAIFSKPLWINIIAASWQQNPMRICKQAGDTVLALVKGYNDGGGSGRLERGDVGRQGALVVLRVSAGGLGNGDADAHQEDSVRQAARMKWVC